MRTIKTAIFDMDGVIIDSEPIYYNLCVAYFDRQNLKMCRDDYDAYVGTTSTYMWEAFRNKFSLPHTLAQLVSDSKTGFVSYINTHCEDVKPVDGIQDFIEDLKKRGFKLAVASSSHIDAINAVVKTLKFENFFDVLVSGENIRKSKPDPSIFLYTANELGVNPRDCFVIEDSRNGTIAAKKAGMKCLGYKNPSSGNQDLSMADVVIDSFLGLDFQKIAGKLKL